MNTELPIAEAIRILTLHAKRYGDHVILDVGPGGRVLLWAYGDSTRADPAAEGPGPDAWLEAQRVALDAREGAS